MFSISIHLHRPIRVTCSKSALAVGLLGTKKLGTENGGAHIVISNYKITYTFKSYSYEVKKILAPHFTCLSFN
jgi:hypothetical protein